MGLGNVKKVIADNIEFAPCGIFNSRNTVSDQMLNIYDEDGVKVDLCYGWAYFEVFGLTDEEFEELKKYYIQLGGHC